MQTFIQRVRASEGFLSAAQVNDARDLVPGTHNYIQHMIAKANMTHNVCTTRISRDQAWRYMVTRLFETKLESDCGEDIAKLPTTFQAACSKDSKGNVIHQVIGFVTCDGFAHVGVIEEVFRGSVLKKSKKKSGSLSLLAHSRFCFT